MTDKTRKNRDDIPGQAGGNQTPDRNRIPADDREVGEEENPNLDRDTENSL